MAETDRINCRLCRHYFITWEPGRPHGCRAFGFKGAQMPSWLVRRNSGSGCRLFEAKLPPRPQRV